MATRVRVVGACSVEGQRPLGRRDRIVLAALVAAGPVTVPPDNLAEALWRGEAPPTWRKVVQGSIARLRGILGPKAIATAPDGYRLTLGNDDIDLRRFERLYREADALVDGDQAALATSLLYEALQLTRGVPYADLEDWAPGRQEADRVAELVRLAEERLVVALLDDGRTDEAASLAASLTRGQPLREHRWSLLAQALYACDRQAEALRSIQHARRTLRDELGVEPGPGLVAVEQAVLQHDPALKIQRSGRPATACPYKGMAVYEPEDADSFFGRDDDIAAGRARLLSSGVLAIVGASGCGKSSLARAGIGPAICGQGQAIAVMTPGTDPLGRLNGVDPSAVLIVDQLEELFTSTHDPGTQMAFAEELTRRALTSPIILTLRADFVGAASTLPPLSDLIERGLHLLGPMSEQQLEAAIIGPAARAGMQLQPGLVELIVRDLEGQSGALPLGSHALAQTWERRDGRTLTVAGYRSTGGVDGAVAATAERLLDRLPPESRRTARSVLLRLVTLSEGGAPVARRAARADLAVDERHVEVLDALLRARLLTADAEAVQVAHEAIGRAWPRLRRWLDEDRDGQRILLHLAGAASEWERSGRDAAELYRGARLVTVEEWMAHADPELTPSERAFVEASILSRHMEHEDLAEREAAQRRANRRLRRALVTVGVLLVAALVAGSLAGVQQQRATRAQRESALDALVSDASALRSSQRDLAALLAIEAHRLAPGAPAESALFGVLTAAAGLERTVRTNVEHQGDAILIDDTTVAVMVNTGAIKLVELSTGREIQHLQLLPEAEEGLMWSSRSNDGRFLATAWRPSDLPERGVLAVWDLDTGRRRFPNVELPFMVGAVAISGDGAHVAASGGILGRAVVMDAETGALLSDVEPLPRPDDAVMTVNTVAVSFTSDGDLIVSSQAGPIRVVEPTTGRELQRLEGVPQTSEFAVLVHADGSTITTVGARGALQHDLETGAPTWRQPADEFCIASAVAEQQGALLCAQAGSGRIVAIDLGTGTPLGRRFDTNQGDVCSLLISADGARLVVGSCHVPDYQIWRLDGGGGATDLVVEAVGGRLRVLAHWDDGLVVHMPDSLGIPVTTVVDLRTGDRTPVAGATGLAPTNTAHIAVGLFPGGVGLVDLRSGGPRGPTTELDFFPNGLVAALGLVFVHGWDLEARSGRLVAVDAQTGQPTGLHVELAGTEIWGVTVLDPRRIATIELRGTDPRVQVRDATTGEPQGDPLPGLVKLAAEGGVVVGITREGFLVELDSTTFEVARIIPGAIGRVQEISMSRDGRRVALLGVDGSVRLFDIPSQTPIGDPIDVDDSGVGIALSADGTQLFIGGALGVTKWDLDPERWVTAACRLAGRNLTHSEWDRHIGDLATYRRTCPEESDR